MFRNARGSTRTPEKAMSERKQRIYSFLKDNPVGVLSTVDPVMGPHGVVIYFTLEDDFKVAFLTRVETRKHHNLTHDNRVMLTVFEPHSLTTAQVVGRAFEVPDSYDINGIASAILGESLKTDSDGMLPITKLRAGPYTAFMIHPDQVRMAVYSRPDPGNYENLFETLESYELENY